MIMTILKIIIIMVYRYIVYFLSMSLKNSNIDPKSSSGIYAIMLILTTAIIPTLVIVNIIKQYF